MRGAVPPAARGTQNTEAPYSESTLRLLHEAHERYEDCAFGDVIRDM